MTIKHLVLSGGGPSMIQTIGSIQVLEESKFIDMQKIETIYGTSAGAIVGVLICLKFDWLTINDYVLRRPWHEVFPIKVQNIFDAYTKKGIFDIKTIEKCFKPLLDAKDISMEVSLKEFYEYSKIELHLFAFEINHFQLEDISYLTHPDLPLTKAIQMTCSVPILVTPVCIDGKCYIDGGIVCNYPLKYCLESGKNEEEVLGLKNEYDYDSNTNYVHSESTLLDFILCFLFKVIHSLSIDHTQQAVKYEVVSRTNFLSLEVFRTALSMVETRKELHQQGISAGKEFLEKQKERTTVTTEAIGTTEEVGATEGAGTTEQVGTTEL
jgi:predicted acylesterase/phospholipase RssA